MKEQHKQGFLYGTLVLAAGTVVVKLIGALFKIPLTNLLGGVGMSYFNVAYDLYYPVYALFVSGVPVAVSKLVSESMARGRARDARRLLRVAVLMFSGLGFLGALLMLTGAGWFTQLVQNPQAKYAVWMLAPALVFGCLLAVLRGYFQGLQDMVPTAISQIIEALAKLVFGLTLAYGVTALGMQQYAQDGSVFGIACDSAEQAGLAVLPFAAAGAILGVSASSLCGTLYIIFRFRFGKSAVPSSVYKTAPPSAPGRQLARRLLAIAVPVCVASVITNLTSFIDLISVMNRLSAAITNNPELLLKMYQTTLPAGVGIKQLASYLYGCYSGLTVPVYNLVPTLTTTIGISLLPAVSAAWATGDTERLSRNIGSALRLASLIAMPAGLGICVLARPILNLLYYAKPLEVATIYPALRVMGVGAVFVALSLPVNAILQAVGRADLPVRLLLAGGLMKLACNFFLVGIPQLNIRAAPIGTLVCYAFILLTGLAALLKSTNLKLSLMAVFGKPLFAAICCALAAYASYGFLERALPGSRMTVLLAIAAAGVVYLAVVLLTRTITPEDVAMLPGGDKLARSQWFS